MEMEDVVVVLVILGILLILENVKAVFISIETQNLMDKEDADVLLILDLLELFAKDVLTQI